MAYVKTPTPEVRAQWRDWITTRPPEIRAVAERLDFWSLYRLKTTGQKVTLYSLSEPDPPRYPGVTVTVRVWPMFNPDRLMVGVTQVFGIDPNDLEPCDELPPGYREEDFDRHVEQHSSQLH